MKMSLPNGLSISRAFAAALVGMLFCAPGVALAQEKVNLAIKAQPGSVSRYKSSSAIKVVGGESDLTINSSDESEIKFLKMDGVNLVFSETTTKSEVSFNGEKVDSPEDSANDGGEFVVKPNGELISYKDNDPEADKESTSLSLRMGQASTVVFSPQPVGVGSTWTHSFKANAQFGTNDGKADYKVAAFETVGGIKTAKIEFTYKESGAKRDIGCSGISWVELSSGETIKSESKYENVPFDFLGGENMVASSTDTSERTGGGFMTSQANTGEKPADGKAPEPKKEEPKKEEDKNSVDVKMKGWEKLEGLFTVYRKVEESRTRYSLEIKKSQLGRLFVLQTTISSGDGSRTVAGNPVSDLVFEFREMPNNKVYLTVPNYNWRSINNAALAKVLKTSFSDSYVESFDIEARQKDRETILVDISTLFTGNISRLFEQVQGGGSPLAMMMGGGSVTPDREKTYIKEFKNFPTNLYAHAIYVFSGGRGPFDPFEQYEGDVNPATDNRASTVGVIYNLFALPESTGYVPRRADARVGFFTVTHRDWSRPEARDQKVQNIVRWDMRKKDPKADLSEPVKPIVFHVDSGFPAKYRETVRDALLSWNKAFERIGIKNAIQVVVEGDNSQLDSADMRNNFVRLVASPSDAYAVALFRTNPITGEILNAAITVDANMLRAIEGDWEVNSPIEAFKSVRHKLDSAPELVAREEALHQFSHGLCSYQKEAARNAAFGATAVGLIDGPGRKEEFAKRYLYNVVQHEFGHILGLRHNFVSSTQLTPSQLSNPEEVKKHNISGSVMDYVSYNTYALGNKAIPFFGETVGDYDFWAIRYGYTDTGIKDSDKEQSILKPIANQGSKWGNAFQTDEQADGLDPYTVRFDLSADPLGHEETVLARSRKLLLTLGTRLPAAGQSYFEFTRTFNALMNQYASSAASATRFLGGARRSFAFKGDASAPKPFEPVKGSEQRRALGMLAKYLFDEKALELPKSYYKLFAPDPKGGSMQNLIGSLTDYPMLDDLADLQNLGISAVLNPGTLARIQNTEWKALPGDDVLPISEVFSTLKKAVWSEVGRSVAVTPLRRQLQRDYVDRLIQLGVRQSSRRTDVNVLAWSQLKQIGKEVAAAKSKDSVTQAHFDELSDRISRALNAVETVGGGGSSRGPVDLSSLLGRKP